MKPASRLAVLLGSVALLLAALPAASAAAGSPWWQLTSGARPTNLPLAPDRSEVQEVSTAKANLFGSEVLVATVEVGEVAIGCLGSGEALGKSCERSTGFPATETAAELQELLEGPYGAGAVKVTGGPRVGEAPFLIETPGRWVAPLKMVPFVFSEVQFGSASAKVVSEGSGRLVITLLNVGDAPLEATEASLTITDELPEGVVAYDAEGFAGWVNAGKGLAGPVECAIEEVEEEGKVLSRLKCSFKGSLAPYEAIEVEVFVALSSTAPGEGRVSVSGGDGPSAAAPQRFTVSAAPTPFGIQNFSAQAEEAGGVAATQAGSHPFQLTTTIESNQREMTARRSESNSPIREVPGLPRNLRFPLPPGLVGNATAVPRCPVSDFLAIEAGINRCPAVSAVGVSSVLFDDFTLFGLVRLPVPVFNLPPVDGEPARFGFVAANSPVLIDTALETGHDYRILAEVHNVSQLVHFLASTTTLWGDPGDPRHDESRGWGCVFPSHPGVCARSEGLAERSFLRLPVSCGTPLGFSAEMEPWNVPLGSEIVNASYRSAALDGCNRVPFDPRIESAPTSEDASTPSGLDFELTMPNSGLESPSAEAAEAQPKKVTVTLPEGVTINASSAEGLGVCTEAEYARETYNSRPGEGCPNTSKIGNVHIQTPLLEEEASGALYLAKPYENPTGSLIALYMVARIPARGVLVKQAGKVTPDPRTGQLVTSFDNLPQLPFSSFTLHFREGARAPLATPRTCGAYTTVAKFVPSSAADPNNPAPGEVVERTSDFSIRHGVDGGACPQGGAPFDPGFEAGTLSNAAGRFSPFYMRLTRSDGQQDLTRFSTTLPSGALARLRGVEECPQAAVEAAKAKTGLEEKTSPSCPQGSEIGHVMSGAGVGSVLTWVPGKLYLGGPYHGDPLSVVAVVPAVAGPFDVGTVVVQQALRLNPVTGAVEVDGSASDPVPHILKGIPLQVRDIRVYVDRPKFTLNATSCEEEQARATIWGGGADVFSSADDQPFSLSARYQAADCAALGFKPKLAIALKGDTRRGAHPALTATVIPRPGDANFAEARVTLPHSAFLDQGHIRTICTRVQFASGNGNGEGCPAASIYGHARAWSPLLEEVLEGPVLLRSSSHELPDMVVALHGIVNIDLTARIDSFHGGIRTSFERIPDAPVSRFVLEMQGGVKGLLVNSTNLCQGTQRAQAELRGQNGRRSRTRPVVRAVSCGKARRHKRHSSHRHARSAKQVGRR